MNSSEEQQGEIRKPFSVQRNRGKQENGKDQRFLQENQRYQGSISCKKGHNKGQKWYGPTEVADIKNGKEYKEELYKKIFNPR